MPIIVQSAGPSGEPSSPSHADDLLSLKAMMQQQLERSQEQEKRIAQQQKEIERLQRESKKKGSSIDVRTPEEMEGLRHACRMGREVIDIAGRYLKAGVTGDEIDRIVHAASMERKAYPSPLNYYKFPKSVCVSPNEVICHGIPDYREVQDGDIVNLDVTTFNRGGYHGDLNETFCVGNVDEDGRKLVKTAFTCLQEALAMVKPGTLYRDLGTKIHKTASAQKCLPP